MKCHPVTRLYRHRGGVVVKLHSIFNFGARWVRCSTTRSGRYILGNKPGTHRRGGWMGPWIGLKGYGKRKCLAAIGFEPRTGQS
jgi:hypothetical protein